MLGSTCRYANLSSTHMVTSCYFPVSGHEKPCVSEARHGIHRQLEAHGSVLPTNPVPFVPAEYSGTHVPSSAR